MKLNSKTLGIINLNYTKLKGKWVVMDCASDNCDMSQRVRSLQGCWNPDLEGRNPTVPTYPDESHFFLPGKT